MCFPFWLSKVRFFPSNLSQSGFQLTASQETFVTEVEVLRSQLQSQEFEIEAEFLTQEEMLARNISESLSQATSYSFIDFTFPLWSHVHIYIHLILQDSISGPESKPSRSTA
jgi:hypothetical protein